MLTYLCDNHLNIEKITTSKFIAYVVKYVAKNEPAFTVSIEQTNKKDNLADISEYFKKRIVSVV